MDPAINKLGGKVEDAGANRKVGGTQGVADKAGAGSGSPNDTVELTSGAQLLERLEQGLKALPEIDSARVAEIRTAIENGNYEVDADAIADAMLRFDRSFGD